MRIPEGWVDYSGLGERITSTPFICFKTPLHTGFHRSGLAYKDRFSPWILRRSIREKGFKLSTVIDLTNTFRYYDGRREFHDRGIRYKKLKCAGQTIPTEEVYLEFCDIVSTTRSRLRGGDNGRRLIGVHCTHGVNRTGYLVCRYLIEYFGFEAEDAIRRFNEARGHDIRREAYVQDLRQRKSGASSHQCTTRIKCGETRL